MLVIDRKILSQVSDHARRAYPAECCGILTGQRSSQAIVVRGAVFARNVADAGRGSGYVLDSEMLIRTMRSLVGTGEKIVGFYHSHPDARPVPSGRDASEAWTGYAYLIVPVVSGVAGESRAWSFDRGKSRSVPIVIRAEAHDVKRHGGRCPPYELRPMAGNKDGGQCPPYGLRPGALTGGRCGFTL